MQAGIGGPAVQLKRAPPVAFHVAVGYVHPFARLLSRRSPPHRRRSTVRRAGRRLFPLSTEQQPAIRRATPFCSLVLSRLREGATGTAASLP